MGSDSIQSAKFKVAPIHFTYFSHFLLSSSINMQYETLPSNYTYISQKTVVSVSKFFLELNLKEKCFLSAEKKVFIPKFMAILFWFGFFFCFLSKPSLILDFPAESHNAEQVYLKAHLANWSNCSPSTQCGTQLTHKRHWLICPLKCRNLINCNFA